MRWVVQQGGLFNCARTSHTTIIRLVFFSIIWPNNGALHFLSSKALPSVLAFTATVVTFQQYVRCWKAPITKQHRPTPTLFCEVGLAQEILKQGCQQLMLFQFLGPGWLQCNKRLFVWWLCLFNKLSLLFWI
jgi:hypothetical protein